MIAPLELLRDWIRRQLGLVPLSGYPEPRPKPTKTTLLVPKTPATMKTLKMSPIKTYGTGLESMSIYGAVPLSSERIQQIQAEAKKEALAHEKEMTALIQLHSKSAGSPPMNGYWGTDESTKRAVADWEARQKALFASIAAPAGSTMSHAPIKTFSN